MNHSGLNALSDRPSAQLVMCGCDHGVAQDSQSHFLLLRLRNYSGPVLDEVPVYYGRAFSRRVFQLPEKLGLVWSGVVLEIEGICRPQLFYAFEAYSPGPQTQTDEDQLSRYSTDHETCRKLSATLSDTSLLNEDI